MLARIHDGDFNFYKSTTKVVTKQGSSRWELVASAYVKASPRTSCSKYFIDNIHSSQMK